MLRFLLIALMLFVSGCATAPRITGVAPESTLEGLCAKYSLDCSWDGIAQTVTMNFRGQKIQALVGSSVVVVGNTKMVLSAPLKRRNGAVVVPPDFEKLVFPAEKIPGAIGAFAGHWLGKVVVDAGHGGKDPGAIGFLGLKEKDINLDIASRLSKDLRDAGIDVIQTRDTDEFITLADRTAVASSQGIDLFISIHSNATKSHHARGFEIYSAGPLNREDRLEAQRQQNEKQFVSKINMRTDSKDLKGIVADMLYMHKLTETPRLAEAVSRGLAQQFGQGSRGSKMARYFVLRNTLVPAVLVEVGFISNPREATLLKDSAYRQKIADAVSQGLMRCLDASQ